MKLNLGFTDGLLGLAPTNYFLSKATHEYITHASQSEKKANWGTNLIRVAEWTPILGQVIGIARLALFGGKLIKDIIEDQTPSSYVIGNVTRGFICGCGLGFLLVVPDIITSIVSFYQYHRHPPAGPFQYPSHTPATQTNVPPASA